MTDINPASQNSNVVKKAMAGDHGETWVLRLGLNEAFASALYQYDTASSHKHITVDSGGIHQTLWGTATLCKQ